MFDLKNRTTKTIRGQVVATTSKDNLQGFVTKTVVPRSTVDSDKYRFYQGLPYKHLTVSQFVRV